MASEPSLDSEASFCGNCGAAVGPGCRDCGVCGHPVATSSGAEEQLRSSAAPAPADYIPYCRGCGIGVPWGQGHTCFRCGVSPLCALHFRASDGLCFDCADAPAYSGTAATAGGLLCGACGTSVAPFADFCPNCGVPLAAPYARAEYMGFWIRCAAFVVDRIVVYLIAALIAAAIGISRTSGDVDPAAQQDVTVSLENINYSFLLLIWGLSVAYGVLFTGLRGQTLGKMLLRIQVVDANGNIPPWHRVIVRELVGKFISEVILWVGYLWIGFDQNKRGWHDYLGGSYVVRKQGKARNSSGIF